MFGQWQQYGRKVNLFHYRLFRTLFGYSLQQYFKFQLQLKIKASLRYTDSMNVRFSIKFLRSLQLVLLGVVAATAFTGGIGLIATNGLGMETNILKPTPFTSFFIPGLILAGIVGGTHAYALYARIKQKLTAQFFSAVAAFGLIIWLFIEVYWLLHTSPLQLIYFTIGILELMIVLGILNVAPWLIKKN